MENLCYHSRYCSNASDDMPETPRSPAWGGMLCKLGEKSRKTSDKLTVFDDGHYLINEDAIFVARSQAASHSAIVEYQTRSAAWREKPSWSVIATLDRTIAPNLQRQMSQRAGSAVEELENGHMLPMTNPTKLPM